MDWNNHSNLRDKHAILSPSGYAWLNYDEEKMLTVFRNKQAIELGTRLHALAKEHIDLGIKMPNTKQTLCMHVNDAIAYRMDAEVVLFYSYNAFGTADAIGFRKVKNKEYNGYELRIHDLKTGTSPTSFKQLRIYAALFFLEYCDYIPVDMEDVRIVLRIYQNDDYEEEFPTAEEIKEVITKIISLDTVISAEMKTKEK